MLTKINKHIAILLTAQTFFSPLTFAAEAATEETFAVKAASALEKNDFTGLENGSATFTYSDGSRAYVKVSDFTATTTAADGSTSTANLGKQYEICSVSKDSRAVSCNYTTVNTDGTKDVKSLDIDNTQEHQIYSVPTNATYTDEDKKYFITSYDNPYYKFKSVDENGHIDGTNCIKLNENKMVCSADSNIDMSKLTASDFQQDAENTEKYQVNKDVLTNAMLSNSDGSCSIEGWVQADSTHCCPPNTDAYSYTWDTAQQQCKVTKNGSSKSDKNNSLTKDLLGAAAILVGSSGGGKKDTAEKNERPGDSTTKYGENVVLQDSAINKNAKVNIKFNPQIPAVDSELKATISVKDTENDKLVIRIQAPSTKIDTLTAKSDKELTLIQADTIEPGKYKLIVYVMNKGVRKATFSAEFEVFDATLVLTDEQKKQYTDIRLEPISEEIEEFNIYGDVSNVRYDEENGLCQFDIKDGYAQTGDTKAFKVTESMPIEVQTDKENCDNISKSEKAYIENGLLHKEGNSFGVVVSEDSFMMADNVAAAVYSDKSKGDLGALMNQTALELGDVSTIETPDGYKTTVEVSIDEKNNAILTDVKTGEVYSLEEYEEEHGLEWGSLVAIRHHIGDTTINRVEYNDNRTNIFYKDAFDKKASEMTDTIKKVSSIRDFTPNMLNTVEFVKKPKEDPMVQIRDGVKHFLSVASEVLNKTDSNGTSVADIIQKMIKRE